MPTATPKQLLADARAALSSPVDFDALLSKLTVKDRTNAQRHVAACDAESDPRHSLVWRRLVCSLSTLAPHATKFNGQQSIQFYVPDGKYRMQVFALEDLRDGKITLYCANVLKEASDAGVVVRKRGKGEPPNTLGIPGVDDVLNVEELDGQTPNPAAFYKDMLGWNRKAIRITLPVNATNAQLEATENLCAISAQKWLSKAA